jgi:hypothetical protein
VYFTRFTQQNHTGIIGLLVSFESEVRLRGVRKNEADFGFGTLATTCPNLCGTLVCVERLFGAAGRVYNVHDRMPEHT